MTAISVKVLPSGTLMTPKWDVDSPISLTNDSQTVEWELKEIYLYPPWKGIIETVFLDFTSRPSGASSDMGPHIAVPQLDTSDSLNPKLIGATRNAIRGTYYYDLVIVFIEETHLEQVRLDFRIDPQIDNVAPPIDMYKNPDPEDDDRGEER